MKTKYIISALLAAGLATAAHANPSSAIPNLLLGFQTSGGASNYEADLGSMANYVGLSAGTTLNLSGDISASDIQGIFGSGAFTGGTVTIGAAATVGVSAPTLNGVSFAGKTTWVTQNDGTVVAGPWTAETPEASAYKLVASTNSTRETGVSNLYGGLNAQPSLSTPNAASVPSGGSFAWSSYVNSLAKNGFGAGATALDVGTNLALTSGLFQVVDLFQYSPGSTSSFGTYTGSLELGSDGSLFFTNFDPVAIPEPSVYATILGAACMGFVAIRRRKQQILA
jgi:hypothetical protein